MMIFSASKCFHFLASDGESVLQLSEWTVRSTITTTTSSYFSTPALLLAVRLASSSTFLRVAESAETRSEVCELSLLTTLTVTSPSMFNADSNWFLALEVFFLLLAINFKTQGISNPLCGKSDKYQRGPFAWQRIVPPHLINIKHIAEIFLGTIFTSPSMVFLMAAA